MRPDVHSCLTSLAEASGSIQPSAMRPGTLPGANDAAERYLDLLKNCLTRRIFEEHFVAFDPAGSRWGKIASWAARTLLSPWGLEVVRRVSPEERARFEGSRWPASAETMIGMPRLDQLQFAIQDVLERKVPGDFIETGVWRGGATIFMRGALLAYGDAARSVWVADSFQGLPRPNADAYPADSKDRLWTFSELAVSREQVEENFRRYGLLDDRVKFLPGWFRDTLPTAPIESLAILRIDGDMYESTSDALVHLYPKLSPGGYAIVDDYGVLGSCRQAVEDYRDRHGIHAPIQPIDHAAIYWQKLEPARPASGQESIRRPDTGRKMRSGRLTSP